MYRLRCAQGARERAPSRDTPRLQRPGPSRAIGIFHSTPSVSSKCDDTNVYLCVQQAKTYCYWRGRGEDGAELPRGRAADLAAGSPIVLPRRSRSGAESRSVE